MKNPINNFHDALNEWNNGDVKRIPAHLLEGLIKQGQGELQRRIIERVVQSRIDEIDRALEYCNDEKLRPSSCEEALQVWHDSDEYATEQAERKGCDDSHADRERD
jgi:hypothetical protein